MALITGKSKILGAKTGVIKATSKLK